MDWRVVAFAFAAAEFSTAACGLAPAWRLSRIQPVESLKTGATEAGRKLRVREWLAGVEVALATVLLAAGGLLLASFVRLTHVSTGLETAHALPRTSRFSIPSTRTPTVPARSA
jgi:fatty acid desaturase